MTEIEVRNLAHAFSDQVLFRDLHFQIQKGERWVFVGPSGYGKSTLLKVLAGLIRPTSGDVFINGQNLNSLSGAALDSILRRMGFLFQRNALFDSLSVWENVVFPLQEASTLTQLEIEKRARFYLDAVGLWSSKDLFPDEISGGMQKRLGIARALVLEPQIIFYDDPTAGLDPITSRKIVDLILDLRERTNSTVVAITNDMNRAYSMADQIAYVGQDKFFVAGTPAEARLSKDPVFSKFVQGLS